MTLDQTKQEMDPLKYAERIAYSSKDVLRFTYDQAVKFKDSPGVYVECGVAAGAQIIAMAYGAPNKTIYAFDSFEGIPFPSNRDDQMPGIKMLTEWEKNSLPDPGNGRLESSGATVVSLDNFYENLYGAFGTREFPNIINIKGWFENTVPLACYIKEIAILRLDLRAFSLQNISALYLRTVPTKAFSSSTNTSHLVSESLRPLEPDLP